MGGGKVGVFTALYDHGKCVGQALRSTLSQKHMPSEVIVIDEAATDDFGRSAQAIGNPLVRVIAEKYKQRNTIWVRQR